MTTMFTKNKIVKLKAIVPTGPVLSIRMEEDGNIQYLIEWKDVDGELKQRWFNEDQLIAAE